MAFLGNVGPVPGENGSWLDPDRPLLLLNRRLPVLFFLPAISRTCFMGAHPCCGSVWPGWRH